MSGSSVASYTGSVEPDPNMTCSPIATLRGLDSRGSGFTRLLLPMPHADVDRRGKWYITLK